MPTLKESGINLIQTSPFGLVAPKGTDLKSFRHCMTHSKKPLDMPNYKESLAKLDMDTYYMDRRPPASSTRWTP